VGVSPRASPALPFVLSLLFQFLFPLPRAFYRGGGQGGREDIERVLERAYGWGLAIAGGASLGVYPVMPVRNI
jgi:O-antigen/teichoic acid export membrane protein